MTRSRVLLAGGLLALAGCDRDEPLSTLFECSGERERYILHGPGDGNLALEIARKAEGAVSVSTWLIWWQEVRTGRMTGQQGGHQNPLRLFDGERHFILYEERNAPSSDASGETYAGVLVARGSAVDDAARVALCEVDATNRTLLDKALAERTRVGLPAWPEEDPAGPFDHRF